jgi:hypothetical protein
VNDAQSHDVYTVDTRLAGDNEVESALLMMRRADIAFERGLLSASRPGHDAGRSCVSSMGWRLEWA